MLSGTFISHQSASDSLEMERLLKAHLLGNMKIVIPAASIERLAFGRVLLENEKLLEVGAVEIAHGSDCSDLVAYPEKYPDMHWSDETLEVFRNYQLQGSVKKYNTADTIVIFNELMRGYAGGEISSFSSIFSNKKFLKEIQKSSQFNLEIYIDIIEKFNNEDLAGRLIGHAKFSYNLFGGRATGVDNVLSFENFRSFSNFEGRDEILQLSDRALLHLLVEILLERTDNVVEFDFLSEIDEKFLDTVSFEQIIEMRQGWLHSEIIEAHRTIIRYCEEQLETEECIDLGQADKLIEHTAGLREMIRKEYKSKIKTELRAYNFYRLGQRASGAAVGLLWLPPGMQEVSDCLGG